MGQGKDDVKGSPEKLEHEVESIREGLDPVMAELGHRRHEMMDWRRHGPTLLKLAAVTAGVFMTVQRIRKMRSRSAKRGAQAAWW